jgi:hypothetical protein
MLAVSVSEMEWIDEAMVSNDECEGCQDGAAYPGSPRFLLRGSSPCRGSLFIAGFTALWEDASCRFPLTPSAVSVCGPGRTARPSRTRDSGSMLRKTATEAMLI